MVGAGVADAGAAVAVPDDEGGGGGVDELAGLEMQMPPTRIAGGVQLGVALLGGVELDGGVLDWLGVGVGVGVDDELAVVDALELVGAGVGSPISCLVASGITGRPPR